MFYIMFLKPGFSIWEIDHIDRESYYTELFSFWMLFGLFYQPGTLSYNMFYVVMCL